MIKTAKKLFLRAAAFSTAMTFIICMNGCLTSKKRDYDGAKFTYKVNADNTLTITGVDSGGNDLAAIKVPRTIDSKTVTVIGKNAFAQSMHMMGDEKSIIVLPDTITKIEEYAFEFSSINDINIPDSVQEIEAYAFSNSSLDEVMLSRNTKVAEKAFSDRVNIIYR